MKRAILCLSIALLTAVISTPVQAKKVRTLRLTSYNIQHGEGLDKKIDHARQAKILRKAHAEIVAIQEIIGNAANTIRPEHLHVIQDRQATVVY